MTHDELVKRAAQWVRGQGYPVVLEDVRINMISEQPDVIGWKNHGQSCLVECKVSIADYKRDEGKVWRREPARGMGVLRYFAVPVEILPAVERDILDRFPGAGLIVAERDRVRVVGRSKAFERDRDVETTLLVQAVRRVTEGWGRRMFGADAPLTPNGDPHPTASKVIRDLTAENMRLRDALRAKSPTALHAIDMGQAAAPGTDSGGVISDGNGKPEA